MTDKLLKLAFRKGYRHLIRTLGMARKPIEVDDIIVVLRAPIRFSLLQIIFERPCMKYQRLHIIGISFDFLRRYFSQRTGLWFWDSSVFAYFFNVRIDSEKMEPEVLYISP